MKFLSLLGLAQRAGKVHSGEKAVESLRRGKVELLILATDVSENTEKELISLAERAKVPWVRAGTKVELGLAVGKSQRAAVALVEKGFAQAIGGAIERES